MKKETKKEQKPLPRLTADQIAAFDDRPTFDYEVPEWGCTLTLREPDAATIVLISKSARDESGEVDDLDFAVKLFLECVVEPLFEVKHLESLKRKSNRVFLRIVNAIRGGKKNESTKN